MFPERGPRNYSKNSQGTIFALGAYFSVARILFFHFSAYRHALSAHCFVMSLCSSEIYFTRISRLKFAKFLKKYILRINPSLRFSKEESL